MGTNVLLFAWSGVKTGREALAAAAFQEGLEYWGGLLQAGRVKSLQPVLLQPNGSDVQGFFLIEADGDELDKMVASDEFVQLQTKTIMYLEGPMVMRGVTGDLVGSRMKLWTSMIPDAKRS